MRASTATATLTLTLTLALVACGDPPDAPSGTDATATATPNASGTTTPADPNNPTPETPGAELPPVVHLDLVAQADRAHVSRSGPLIAPTAPGWRRVTQLADRGPWKPPRRIEERQASWLEGIGGTLHIPVGAEGPDLRHLVFWMRPVGSGQRVSIFVDEVPVTTMRLARGWKRYKLLLPVEGGLAPGDHSVRFWFRFTRNVGRGKKRFRTPAAIADLRLLPLGPDVEAPADWVADLEIPGADSGPALLAGPPAAWSFYLMPPVGGRFVARPAVTEGTAVDFVVRLDVDGEAPREVRINVPGGGVADLDVDLTPYEERPLRLTLETRGDTGPLGRAGWLHPRITTPGRPHFEVPTVRNIVVVAVDGLRGDRVGLGRSGDRAATPNLDLLAAQGAAAIDVWSGGASAADGHRRLLRPDPEGAATATLVASTGRKTGMLSSSTAISPELAANFSSRLDRRRDGEPEETRIVLRELAAWLYVRKRHPFFLYIASADPRFPIVPSAGYKRVYERARPLQGIGREREALRKKRDLFADYDAGVSAADYWLGQVVALLDTHGLTEHTAIVVVGSVGTELREHGGLGDGHALVPELLQVPLVVWHPALRAERPRPIVEGGDLADVAALVLQLAGAAPPASWPSVDLATSLFRGAPVPPHPSHARHRNHVAARYGDWLLRGPGNRELHLWNLDDDPAAREEISADHPIGLRVLRDSMLDRH